VRWLDGPRRAFTVNIAQPASVPNGNDVKPRNVNYVYGGPTNPVSPDPEQVTALTNVADSTPYATFAYDAAGNQTQRVIGDVAWLYLYDGEDRLRRVTKKSATTPMLVYSIEEYWYDENGSRIGVLKRDGAGVAQELIWFIGDTQAHYTAAGVVSKVLSHLSLGTPVARVERTGNTTTAIEYQFHGMASNTIAAVAADGTVNANVVYAPYGEVLEAQEAGGSVFGLAGHRRRFNDKYVDEIGGLGYYGARYYDNVLIGWTQADPKYRVAPDAAWSEPRRAMLYSFGGQNPMRYIDPDGRDFWSVAFSHIDWDELAKQLETGTAGKLPIKSGPTGAQISGWIGSIGEGCNNKGNGSSSNGGPPDAPVPVEANSGNGEPEDKRMIGEIFKSVKNVPKNQEKRSSFIQDGLLKIRAKLSDWDFSKHSQNKAGQDTYMGRKGFMIIVDKDGNVFYGKKPDERDLSVYDDLTGVFNTSKASKVTNDCKQDPRDPVFDGGGLN